MELRDGVLELLDLGTRRRELTLGMGYGLVGSFKHHVQGIST